MTDDHRWTRRLRVALLPFAAVTFLGSWVLLDILFPPEGVTILNVLTARGPRPEVGPGSFLHAVAATCIAMLIDIGGVAVLRWIERRQDAARKGNL